jgi:hypothetical protein
MIPGMELFYEASKGMNDSTILSRMFEYDRSRIYRQLAATANAQDVTLYTIPSMHPD